MKREWYYHGTSRKRWESIQMYSAFMVLPVYLTTDKAMAEHYAKARAAYEGDDQYAIIGLCLTCDKVLVDNYSDQEPGQYKLFRQIHQNTFYSQYVKAECFPMPTAADELVRLKAYCVGMGWGDTRTLAPQFKHSLREE